MWESRKYSEYPEITPEEMETLGFLLHDKAHIAHPDSIREVESVISKYSEPAPTLWRGLRGQSEDSRNELTKSHKGELHYEFLEGKTFTVPYILSFSEDPEVAKGWSHAEEGYTVMRLDGAEGFSYWEYDVQALKELKERDPDEYESYGGDFLIEGHEEEKEWLIKGGTEFLINRITKDGEYTILECTMVK